MIDILALTKQLIQIESITPEDTGCQPILQNHLKQLGFSITEIPCQRASNFFAIRNRGGPVFAFAGHTDVVAVGNYEKWNHPPFSATEKEGFLYGRGAADMKGSLAAMLSACERYIHQNPDQSGTIAFLITSAEEGPSELGTPQIIEYLQKQKQSIDYCIVGEPTANQKVGDTIKNGRRGSLTGQLTINGKQGHIAYPHLADNPIHRASHVLTNLLNIEWDKGNAFFQPTSLQFSNIHSGTGQGNVIPGDLNLMFNFRYSPEVTADQLQQKTELILQQANLSYDLQWTHYGKPFLTTPGPLTAACLEAIQQHCGFSGKLSTSGGTSDARYIAPYCDQVVELGPCNATIHQINEHIAIEDLYTLSNIYESILTQLLRGEPSNG